MITPTIRADAPEHATRDQLLSSIQQGFGNYLQTSRMQPENITIAFGDFIKLNPSYQLKLQKYTNLTIAESVSNLQKPPTNVDISKAKVDAPYKIIDTVINGTTYQITYSHATIGNRAFVKICGAGGVDPWVEFERTPLSVYYPPAGREVQYGEVNHVQIYFPQGDAENFRDWFDNKIPLASGMNKLIWIATGGIWTAFGPQGSGAIANPLASMLGNPSTQDINSLKAIVDEEVEVGNGLLLRLDDTYIYPTISPMDLFTHMNDLAIYASSDGGSSFQKAWPASGIPFYNVIQILAAESCSYSISKLFDQGVAAVGGEGTWGYITQDFFDEMPAGESLLKLITIYGLDISHSQYTSSADVSFDGVSTIGTTGSTFPVTPEQHEFHLPQFVIYDLMFYQYEGLGSEETITIPVTSDTTITAQYATPYQLTIHVNGNDQYSQYYYDFANTGVYANGNYIGSAPGTFTLAGPQVISVDGNTDYFFPTEFTGFGDSPYLDGTHDVTLYASYWVYTM